MTSTPVSLARGFVWDASALNHVGKAGRLDVLGSFTAGPPGEPWAHFVTDVVVEELDRHGVRAPLWCDKVSAVELDDIVSYARWTTLMSDGIHDLGEASTAAWATDRELVAVIDDRQARQVARRNGCDAHGSMWMLCECISAGLLDANTASNFADEIKAAGAYLPFERRDFVAWATRQGLLP